jgi:excinuclease ABC subunit C
LVAEADYRARVAAAAAFLEGRALAPLDRVIREMTAVMEAQQFERAARLRERFEALEWLLAATMRARTAIEALTFVYTDPGAFGDARAYVIRRATVRASAPAPLTPIEREAFRALVAAHATPEPAPAALAPDTVEEMLLVLGWFRRHPAALRRTQPLQTWLDQSSVA